MFRMSNVTQCRVKQLMPGHMRGVPWHHCPKFVKYLSSLLFAESVAISEFRLLTEFRVAGWTFAATCCPNLLKCSSPFNRLLTGWISGIVSSASSRSWSLILTSTRPTAWLASQSQFWCVGINRSSDVQVITVDMRLGIIRVSGIIILIVRMIDICCWTRTVILIHYLKNKYNDK